MLVLLLLLPAMIFSKCPFNWVENNGYCYFYSPPEENDFILHQVVQGKITINTYLEIYLGGWYNHTVNAWQWTDGSPMDWTNFKNGPPKILPTDHTPLSFRMITFNPTSIGQWYEGENDLGNYAQGIVCKVPVCDSNGRSASSILQQKPGNQLAYMQNSNSWFYGCPSCWAQTYLQTTAETICQTLGAHLPSVHNAYQNTELLLAMQQICKQESKDPTYELFAFGALTNATGSDWMFTDGSAINYNNWGQYEPGKYSHNAYSYITPSGYWFTDYLGLHLLDFGCQLKVDDNLCQ